MSDLNAKLAATIAEAGENGLDCALTWVLMGDTPDVELAKALLAHFGYTGQAATVEDFLARFRAGIDTEAQMAQAVADALVSNEIDIAYGFARMGVGGDGMSLWISFTERGMQPFEDEE